MSHEFHEKLKKVKLFIMDVDGVLTDGRIVYGDHGDELKFFDVQDGLGITLLRHAGIATVMLSSKKSRVNKRRAKELKIGRLFQGVKNKLDVYEKLLKSHKVADAEVCYVADDIVDLPAFKRAGAAVAVQNAVEEIKKNAHYVTQRPGGHGAVREIIDHLLHAQHKWNEVLTRYMQG